MEIRRASAYDIVAVLHDGLTGELAEAIVEEHPGDAVRKSSLREVLHREGGPTRVVVEATLRAVMVLADKRRATREAGRTTDTAGGTA